MRRFGGAKYGGIEPSGSSPNVFLYSDPSRGKAYGYTYDGWTNDRDVFLCEHAVGDVDAVGDDSAGPHRGFAEDTRAAIAATERIQSDRPASRRRRSLVEGVVGLEGDARRGR
jgi:hypothetical protein